MPSAASDAGHVVRLDANAEKSWSVVPIVASRPSKMLLIHGNVAFAEHDRDRPESDDVRNELRNGISSGSNISDLPALSRIKTTVRKCCEGSKPRTGAFPRSIFSDPSPRTPPPRLRTGTQPRPT